MLATMLLRCPRCGTQGALRALGPGQLACDTCGAEGLVVTGSARMETVGKNGPVRVSAPSMASLFAPKPEPPMTGVWHTIIREAGIGDLLFTVPLAAELKRRGRQVCYRCPRERYVLVRHVADLWQPIRSDKPCVGDVTDLRGVADDGRPLDHLNRPEAYCRHAGIEAEDYRFWSVPTESQKTLAAALRSSWGGGPVAVLCPKASRPERDMPDYESVADALQTEGWRVVNTAHRRHPLQQSGDGAQRRMDLDDLIASVLAADVVVAADSGPLYLASAYGKPCVGVFALIDPMLRLAHQTGWIAFAPGANDPTAITEAAGRVHRDHTLREVVRPTNLLGAVECQ